MSRREISANARVHPTACRGIEWPTNGHLVRCLDMATTGHGRIQDERAVGADVWRQLPFRPARGVEVGTNGHGGDNHQRRGQDDQDERGPNGPREDQSVRGTNRSAGEDQSVRKGGPIGPPSRERSKEVSREVSREKAFSRKFWDSDQFEMAWNEWKEYRLTQHQFEHRAAKYEELELHQLHQNTNGDERTAIEAIATAITRGWRGIFPRTPKGGENIGRTTDWARDVAQRLQERHSNQ